MSEVMEKENTELAELPPKETALAVYSTVGGLDPYLQRIKAEIDAFVPDTKTAKGRAAIASMAFKVAKIKTAIEAMGKAVSADLKEIPKKVDAERKRTREKLELWQTEVRKPLTDWEEAEAARVDYHKRMIQHIKNCALGLIDSEPQPYAILFRELEEKIVINGTWEEFEAEAHRAKAEALEKLKASFAEQQKRDAEQAELTRLRAESEARAKLDEERRIAKEAAAAATKAAEAKAQAERDASAKREADAKAAQAKAEQDAKDAKERQRRAEEQAETERLASVERVKQATEAARLAEVKRQQDERDREAAETAKREADKRHKSGIMRQIKEAIMIEGIDEDQARAVVLLMAVGEVPNVQINY